MKKIFLSVTIAITFNVKAQIPILEKSYEISNKAKRGFLESIEINKEKETIDMVYVLPNASTTKRESFLGIVTANGSGKVKYEIYSYDKDLNLLGTSREEERMYSNRWKGYSYTTVMPWIKINCMCLAFKQIETTASYNWFSGYKKTTKDLGKTKAETEDGGNYSYTGIYYDVAADKSVLALAGKKIKKTTWNEFLHYDILNVDGDVNIKVADSINFQYGNMAMYSGPIKDQREETNDELARDWIIVFAPMNGTISKHTKSIGDPKSTNLTYVRISPKGKILEKLSFDSPSNAWNIEGVYEHNGSVYLYGSAITKEPAKNYYNDIVNKGWDQLTLTNHQIARITNGKLDFTRAPSFKDIVTNQAKPANQKKLLEIDGKEYVTTGINILNSGDILITYQDYETESAPAKQGGTYKKQNSVFLFHFDAAGNFKKNYGVEINPDPKDVEKFSTNVWEVPANHYFYPSGDGKNMYWLIRSVKDANCIGEANAEQNTIECKPMNGINYGTVNLESGEISEFKTFGEDKKNPFYLFSKTAGYQMGNYLYFFSETEKGDKMLLTRMDISK